MTVFGFLATVVCCATAVVLLCILIKHPIHTHVHHYTHSEHENKTPIAVPLEEKTELVDTELKQMDAVISAVNQLMGIETEENNVSK